jgi:hypothetical protein
MNGSFESLLDFVEGRTSAKEFEQRLYNDPSIELLLRDPSLRWHDTYIKTNPYEYLIELNYDDPGHILNAQGAIEAFLKKKSVPFDHTTIYSDFCNLLYKAQPKWLRADSNYLKSLIVAEGGGLNGEELLVWLTTRLRELFRYHKKPPKWIQSPAWPINQNGPMYFLGWIKIEDCELFHDNGAAFVFCDQKTGESKTIIQMF